MKHLRNQPQKPVVQQQTPQSSVVEKQTMTFEVNEHDKHPGNDNADQGTAAATSVNDKVVRLRAHQAALDVVLDNVSLMRAQSRLMGLLDVSEWNQAAVLCKEEVARLKAELTEGASFEELVYAAEDAGEDIMELSERLGVDVTRIADALDNRGTVKI